MITDIIFDFFGTLVNYTHGISDKKFETSHRYLQAQGLAISYQTFLDGWSGAFDILEQKAQADLQEYSIHQTARYFLTNASQEDVDDEVVDRLVVLFLQEWNKGVHYHPNIETFLTGLAENFRLSIISNTHYSPLVDNHLTAMGIDHLFATVTKSVDHGLRKPHPKIFTDTLTKLGIAAEQAVYVGDSFSSDYEGAQSASIKAILIDPESQYLDKEIVRVDHLYDIEHWI